MAFVMFAMRNAINGCRAIVFVRFLPSCFVWRFALIRTILVILVLYTCFVGSMCTNNHYWRNGRRHQRSAAATAAAAQMHCAFKHISIKYTRKETQGNDVNMLCIVHMKRQSEKATINLIVFGWQACIIDSELKTTILQLLWWTESNARRYECRLVVPMTVVWVLRATYFVWYPFDKRAIEWHYEHSV